jgi:spore maturation protein CgeB
MNILVLYPTDQSNQPLGRFIDLHCNYDFEAWKHGFSTLQHNIHYFDYYKSFVQEGVKIMQGSVLNIILEQRVDLVIIPNMYYEIGISFLRKLNAQGIRSLVVFFDDSTRFELVSRYYIGMCDYILTQEGKPALKYYNPYDVNVSAFPCFPSVTHYNKILSLDEKESSETYEVSFVGAKIADRSSYQRVLNDSGIEFAFFGSGWPRGRISQKDMINVFHTSKISLNFVKNIDPDAPKQLKARAFEVVLAGGFLLTEQDDYLCEYFTVGEEIDVFLTPEECLQKVEYYLAHPKVREKMRRKAMIKCQEALNFESAWSSYLTKIKDMSQKGIGLNRSKHIPEKAIAGYLNWSIATAIARLKNRQFLLAIDQVRHAGLDMKLMSTQYSNRIWFLVATKVFVLSAVQVKIFLADLSITKRLRGLSVAWKVRV